MKENELRIGNYYRGVATNEICQMSLFNFHEWYDSEDAGDDTTGDWMAPIKLTEEWLEKFGFVSNPYEDRYEKNDFHIHCDKTKGFLDLWVTNCRVDLKSVHQLQNLYFALTGDELTIKQ